MPDQIEKLQSLSIDRSASSESSGVAIPLVLGAVVVALLLGVAGGWWISRSQAETATPPRQVATDTSPATPAEASPAPAVVPRAAGLVASGYVVARRQATVSSEVSGRLRELLVEEGTVVEAGQVLARLDDDRAQLDLELLQSQAQAARARVDALQAQLTEARTVLGRASQLADREIGPVANVTAAEAQVGSLRAQIAAAQADFVSAQVRVANQVDLIERYVVRAPFAGVVIAKNAQVGEILSPASAGGGFTRTGVATLVDMASLEIEIDVNEGQIQRVTAGQRVEAVLDAYPDWRIPAAVEAIIPTADRSRATIKVRVRFEALDPRILPDMAARVTFIEGGD